MKFVPSPTAEGTSDSEQVKIDRRDQVSRNLERKVAM